MTDLWNRYLRRAETLEQVWPESTPLLRYFRSIVAAQEWFHGVIVEERWDDMLPRDVVARIPEFMKLLLQPYGVWHYSTAKRCEDPEHDPTVCPLCERSPLASVMRRDATTARLRRNLLCSFCPTEWSLARVLCPACKEESPDRLCRLSIPAIPWIQVDACDTCRKYLKVVDPSVDPRAEPVVDELASIALDRIALERNYTRFVPNLAGGGWEPSAW